MKRCGYGHDMSRPYIRLNGRNPECRECRKRRREEQHAREFGRIRTDEPTKTPAPTIAWPAYEEMPL